MIVRVVQGMCRIQHGHVYAVKNRCLSVAYRDAQTVMTHFKNIHMALWMYSVTRRETDVEGVSSFSERQ